MDLFNTKEALEQFNEAVIAQAKKNLELQNRNVTGKLSRSLKYTVEETDNTLSSKISMRAYGEFLDKGVSGVKKKYDTDYSYKKKMPPPSKLDKWVIKRGIAPRDKKGRFIPRKSVLFAIARGIYNNGIKPSLFLTKPFESMRKELPVKLTVAFTEDAKGQLSKALLKLENK